MEAIDFADFYNHTDIMKYFDAHRQFPTGLLKLFQGIKLLYQLFTAYKKRDSRLVAESNSHLCVMNIKFVLKDEDCFTTLHSMCALGVLDRVKNLVEMYGNVEVKDKNGKTPLHIACEEGHIDVAEYLICEYGCDKEAKDDEQYTPLFASCLAGQIDMVKYLVSRFGCKFDIRDATGKTPLHIACANGYTDIIEYLINECGCDKEDRDNEFQFTPLFAACLRDQISTVKFLISKFRCKVDARDVNGRTPLHVASYCGFQEIVSMTVVAAQRSEIKHCYALHCTGPVLMAILI